MKTRPKKRIQGSKDFQGQKIYFSWLKDAPMPGGKEQHRLEATYYEPIIILDHGNGLEYALLLLENELINQKNNHNPSSNSNQK